MCTAGRSFEKRIKEVFFKRLPNVKVVVFDEIESTNTEAKKYAACSDSGEAVLFIAKKQIAGRGRLGRSFLSQEGGLYISYLSYPHVPIQNAIKLTAFAATALCETVYEFTGIEPKIKWVNDCFIGDKKLAGILTEGEFDESGKAFKYTVVGIGVNLARVDFGDLSDIATSLEAETGSLPDIAEFSAALARRLLDFDIAKEKVYMKKYRELSMLPGRRIKVITSRETYFATAEKIEDDGSLTVVKDSGETVNLISGDVSIRPE